MDRMTGYATDKLKFTSTGVCPGCQECADVFNVTLDELEVLCSNGDIFDEGSFSWFPCNECNTTLGGTSYFAHGVNEHNEIVHFTVCFDCLMEMSGYTYDEEFDCYE